MLLFEIIEKNFGGCIEIYDGEDIDDIVII